MTYASSSKMCYSLPYSLRSSAKTIVLAGSKLVFGHTDSGSFVLLDRVGGRSVNIMTNLEIH